MRARRRRRHVPLHAGQSRRRPEISDFQGSKQLIAIDQKIAGGCIGQDHAGMTWDCYIGEEAVRMEILTEDLLGQPELEPGRG